MLCTTLAFSASADMIVDLGSARDFMFLDIGTNPSIDGVLSSGVFNGKIGWSGGAGTQVKVTKGTLAGELYLAEGATIELGKEGLFEGVEYASADMGKFIMDVNAAVAQFGMFSQDLYLGTIDQRGGLTIDRTDAYTVVDLDSLKLTSGTLTLNGQADDIFYIRVRDAFDLNNVDVVINGTDASRVFFIYEGSGDLEFKGGDFKGKIIAPYASVLLSNLEGFDGSVISGGGFSVTKVKNNAVFNSTPAIPEATALSLMMFIGCTAIFTHRIFRFRKAGQTA